MFEKQDAPECTPILGNGLESRLLSRRSYRKRRRISRFQGQEILLIVTRLFRVIRRQDLFLLVPPRASSDPIRRQNSPFFSNETSVAVTSGI